jgi:pyruvate dehydrogenase E2 component (dihydrolipoamide acetyltransferase)
MAEFRMPSLGSDMEAGTLVEWLVEPGQPVKRGDVVAVVETQKGAIEIEVFEDGTVDKFLVEPGTKVPVGTPLALIAGKGDAAPPSAPSAPAAAAKPTKTAKSPLKPPPKPPPEPPPEPSSKPKPSPRPKAGGRRLRVSPAARRLAEAQGVDLAALTGTGPGGAIALADVEQAAAGKAPPPAPDRLQEMRKAIAAAMSRSKREIPHYYLSETIDLETAMRWLRAENEQRPVQRRLLPAALLLRAVALALAKVPEFNGYWVDDAFQPGSGIHLGVAVALRGGGLIAPALHDVDKLGLDEVQAGLLDLVKRTRAGGLRGSEMTDATITVTSLGELGADSVFGVIYPPQVALIGFGRIEDRPWAVGDALAIRPLVTASLSADHRASDGQRGSKLLGEIASLLQTPEAL